MRKSTLPRRAWAITPENDDARIWLAAEATATAGGMPMKNRSGVRMKPPPTPNSPDSIPTIAPISSRPGPLTETSAIGR
jgi:hypothetical protein